MLTRIMVWFTLFFIPIFPYEINHRLTCPICKYGFVLNGEQISKIKPLAEANQLLINSKITQEEYALRLGEILSTSNQPEVISVAVGAKTLPEGTKVALSYCASCGNEIVSELNFCGHCGNPVLTK